MTKIEILELVKHDGQDYLAGEVRIVDEALAQYFCGNGWAKDPSGTIATGPRDVGTKRLDIHNAKHPTKAPTLGVK